MQIESHAPMRLSTSRMVPKHFGKAQHSEENDIPLFWFASGDESRAVSPNAESLEKMIVVLKHILDSTLRPSGIFCVTLDALASPHLDFHFAPKKGYTQLLSDESKEWNRIANELHAVFEAEPLEDGMSHPADRIIEGALQSPEDKSVLDNLLTLSLDEKHPSFSASILRCLGRQKNPGTSEWRLKLIETSLTMDSVEIRDAAVQAAEFWNDQNLESILRDHQETKPWLREYIQNVLRDWAE